MTRATLLLSLLALAACGPEVDGAYRAEIEAYRQDRLDRLRQPDGWLSLVGLHWLTEGAHPFGSDSANAVAFPPPAPARIGTFEVRDSTVTMRVDPGVPVTVDGRPVTEVALVPDTEDSVTTVRLGTLSWQLIRRSHGLAVRIRDSASPNLTSFDGIDTYAPDPRYRLVARFEAYDPPRPVRIPSITGTDEQETAPGALVFDLGGRIHRLDVTGQPGDARYFLVFGDPTNGNETYGGGRYLYVDAPGADGRVVVDFNRAYNPPCVFTPYATCPLPPPQNRLPVRVEAGEKSYGTYG